MKIRSFIAIPIHDEIKRSLGKLIATLRESGADIKWVRPDNLHLTLKFLGNIDDTQVTSITNRLDTIGENNSPFSFKLSGTGTFPGPGRPRVIWVGLKGFEPATGLFREIDDAMADEEFEREKRPFSPHITIGRVRSQRGIAKLMEELVKYKDAGFGTQDVESLHLMKSVLKPGGAEYSLLHKAPLRRKP